MIRLRETKKSGAALVRQMPDAACHRIPIRAIALMVFRAFRVFRGY
jgi:hypothetical protein